ncbi:uncharacterized protein M6B38_272165 [Iris pallida]|uniref:Uncharacterized protein n=1 Tax=Iris pallida TaxID=29817 RepID=A0AAX6DMA1_IRIPA|nr:Uncharacterized protein M6B38_237710 [Iris pallida]KAJ6848969.1 uncharacterized protein M6B38_272165 [Iris pallida]
MAAHDFVNGSWLLFLQVLQSRLLSLKPLNQMRASGTTYKTLWGCYFGGH